jgi:hypothetical protein
MGSQRSLSLGVTTIMAGRHRNRLARSRITSMTSPEVKMIEGLERALPVKFAKFIAGDHARSNPRRVT